MMTIKVFEEGNGVVIAPEGKIDHVTAEEFQRRAAELAESHDNVTLDMTGVEYVSSAALRAILYINDIMENKGSLVLKNVNQKIQEILRITGFIEYLDIK